jgi:hypothetical protein
MTTNIKENFYLYIIFKIDIFLFSFLFFCLIKKKKKKLIKKLIKKNIKEIRNKLIFLCLCGISDI